VQYAPEDTRQNRAKGQECAVGYLEHGENTGDACKMSNPAPTREMVPDHNEGGGAGHKRPVRPANVKAGECLFALEVCAEIGLRLGNINEAKPLGALLRLIV
jgi:hypothetical protein